MLQASVRLHLRKKHEHSFRRDADRRAPSDLSLQTCSICKSAEKRLFASELGHAHHLQGACARMSVSLHGD